jgi:hypothetical protein
MSGSRIVLFLVAAMLQGCGFGISSFSLGGSSTGTSLAEEEATGSDAATRPTNVSVTKSNPLEAYIAVGGTIKRCWFNATDPLLPNHVYRADVSPGGGKVKITVHQRAKLGRAGLTTYIIDFKRSGPSTLITTENRKMPPCRQDAVRHQPLATWPIELQQDDADRIVGGKAA